MLQTRHESFSGIPHIRMRSASGNRDAGLMHHTGQRKTGQLATDVALCYAQMLATRFMRYDATGSMRGPFFHDAQGVRCVTDQERKGPCTVRRMCGSAWRCYFAVASLTVPCIGACPIDRLCRCSVIIRDSSGFFVIQVIDLGWER